MKHFKAMILRAHKRPIIDKNGTIFKAAFVFEYFVINRWREIFFQQKKKEMLQNDNFATKKETNESDESRVDEDSNQDFYTLL